MINSSRQTATFLDFCYPPYFRKMNSSNIIKIYLFEDPLRSDELTFKNFQEVISCLKLGQKFLLGVLLFAFHLKFYTNNNMLFSFVSGKIQTSALSLLRKFHHALSAVSFVLQHFVKVRQLRYYYFSLLHLQNFKYYY